MYQNERFGLKCLLAVFCVVCFLSLSQGVYDLVPWATNTDPTDSPKTQVKDVTTSNYQYSIVQGGTMDGTNCRSAMGVWPPPIVWTWESNRTVKLENLGTADITNPWLSNGRNNFRNRQEAVDSAITAGMTDREKAIAVWFQQIKNVYHEGGDNSELGNPVKVLNVYGYNTCGNNSYCMSGLWNQLGFNIAPSHTLGHNMSQVYYDGGWHTMDANQQTLVLKRDNRTIPSEQEMVYDHDLIKRTHTKGILDPDGYDEEAWYAPMFLYESGATGTMTLPQSNMNMVLRPNEALTWRWGHTNPLKCFGKLNTSINYPTGVCNGLWEYRPDFTNDTVWRSGATSVSNIVNTGGVLTATSGQTGTIVWKITSPYVLVGGKLEVTGSGATFSISWDNSSWTTLTSNDLDSKFPSNGTTPRYEYYIRCQLTGSANLGGIGIVNDIQMAPFALPGMVVGNNSFTYTDASTSRNVRITHEWVERSATNPPNPPASAIFPANSGESDGTDIVFKWNAAIDPDADSISDYQFELSERSDMKLPLSTNFYKLISKTDDSGKAQYTLPYPGLLTPDRTYYWHVKAKDNKGVWGAWSNTWSFTARGPDYPVNVTMDTTTVTGKGTLKWSANSAGRTPAKYRVYGSDEKGFTISDTTHTVVTGGTSGLTNPFPSNFVCETTSTQLDVVGTGLTLPNTNKAYYRVVAVDSNNKRSWSSEYACAPRPFIYSVPVTTAQVGVPYQYQVSTIRSIGDLRYRTNSLTAKFWDIEMKKFAIQQSPDWLVIDENTGLITGTPGISGTVIVSVTLEKEVRVLDLLNLQWGLESVTSTSVQVLGPFTQEFVIDAGTVTDSTPPSAITQVRDGTVADEEVTNLVLQLSANWNAASDPESGVYYKYAIGTTAGASDVVNWTYSSTTTVTKTGLSLTNGQRYYFSVYAKNGAGMQSQACNSNGILVLKAPTIFTDNFDGWTAKPGPWDSAVGENSLHIISTTTEQNKSGGSCLKVVDNASSGYEGAYIKKAFDPGLSEDVYVRFFFYYPTGFKATGGNRTLAQLLTTDGKTIYICTYDGTLKPFLTDSVSWALASWPGSDLSENRWYCFETHAGAPSASTAFEFWVDGTTSTARLTGKNFGAGTWDTLKFGDVYSIWGSAPTGTFYLDELVVADHYIGTVVSTWTQPQDTTAPAAPTVVRDGTSTTADLGSTASSMQLSANWDASTDAESGVAGYQYAIGTTAGSTNITGGWISNGMNLVVTKTGLSLTAGVTYYFTVRAVNGTGINSVATNSNGQFVQASTADTTPPSPPSTVNDGTSATADIGYTASTTELSANWAAAIDNESGISNYQFSIGTTPGGTQTSGWATIGNVLSVTKTGLSLSVGTTYYFSVKAVNGVSLEGSATNSNGQCVVSSVAEIPPVISNVQAANITATSASISWTTDKQATSQVEYGITAVYGSQTTEDSSLVTDHNVVLASLSAGRTYHYRVISKDSNGRTATSVDNTFDTPQGTENPEIKAYPNPYSISGNQLLKFHTGGTTGGSAKIYTMAGKLVRELPGESGPGDISWDGKNNDGEKVVRGIYIYRITESDGDTITGKLAVTK